MACWGLPATEVELAARRIRWLQTAVADPQPHRLWVAVMWGQARFEETPELDERGRLREGAHGTAARLQEDSAMLAEFDVAPQFYNLWREAGES